MLIQHEGTERFEQLIVAHHDQAFTRQTSRCFRRLGWQVYSADTAAEARRLTQALNAAVLVLDTELPDESGWLACAKLTGEQPDLKVFLVSPRRSAEQARFADFVGAAGLVWRYGGLRALAEEVDGALLPAAG